MADTAELGRVEVSGTIEEFVHDGDKSYISYRVKERELLDHGLMSWIVSRVSLSMAERLFGPIRLSGDLPTTVKKNTVKIDFSRPLAASRLGQTKFNGTPLLDMLKVTEAKPKEGGIEFKTALTMPDTLKDGLLRILKP